MQIGISGIWLVFAVLFFLLGRSHWRKSERSIPPFAVPERPDMVHKAVQILGADVDRPIREFMSNFNAYLARQNAVSRDANRKSAFGYFLATVMAILSLILEWRHEIAEIVSRLSSGCT